jgi:ferredoxin
MADQENSQKKSKYKIVVDKNACIGAAPCVAIAGGVFQLDEEGKAYVVDPNGADDETILMAAQSCPVKAISIFDQETGKQIYPPA